MRPPSRAFHRFPEYAARAIPFVVVTALAGLVFLSACDDGTGPGNSGQEVAEYFAGLPSWSEFSDTLPAVPPTPDGPPDTLDDVTVDVEQIEEDGSVTVIPDVKYRCVQTPYTMQDTPEEIVMYNPDTELLWPGALIQGKSYRDGLGSLLGLPIAERSPISVSIPDFATGDNFRVVDQPNQAAVGSAVGSIVGNATATGLAAPSTISFEQDTYYSEQEFGLSIGVSGRYLGFSASATGEFDRKASQTTVTAHFYQRMYTVVVEPPQTPAAFFSEEFTQKKLQQQIDLGRIGPDNLPVYLSNIVYGRMMIFSFTSTASEQEIKATLNAAYSTIGASVETNLSAKQKKILQESTIAVASLGGNAEATLSVIRSGDWSQYFTDDAPLSSAAPLSYTFRNLGDGSIAKVTEATDYSITECHAIPATPGTFHFLEQPQAATLAVPAPVRTLTGDFDGDGRMDLIWNHLGATNELYLGLSNGDGTFSFTTPVQHPLTPVDGWGVYGVQVADLDGDGRTDLVWTRPTYPAMTYLAISNGDGTFRFEGGQTLDPMDAATVALATDMDADGLDDMVWEYRYGSLGTAVQVGRSDGDTLQFLPRWTGSMSSDAGAGACFDVNAGDLTGNGRGDLVWSTRGCPAAVAYLGTSNGDGTWSHSRFVNGGLPSFSRFATRVGDVTGDGLVDVIWTDTAQDDGTNERYVAVGVTTPAGGLQFQAPQPVGFDAAVPYRVRLADLDGDGDLDLVWNTSGTVNRIEVGLGTSSGSFDLSAQSQLHPADAVPWDQYRLFTGDVNGDGRADLLWNRAAADNTIYVALAKS